MSRASAFLLTTTLFAFGAAGGAFAQTSLPSIVQPVTPKPELGLPDKGAPAAATQGATETGNRQSATSSTTANKTLSWESDCMGEGAARICQAIVRASAGGQVALVMSVAVSKDGGTKMQMALPLGFALKKGVTITVGDFSQTFMSSRCTAQGCLIEDKVPPTLIAQMVTAKSGEVTIFTMEDAPIRLPLPLENAAAVFSAVGITGGTQ